MTRPLTRSRLLATTVIAGLSLAALSVAAPARAQEAPEPDQGAVVDDIVVTGSRIRRSATNAPTPLIQLTREELDNSGEANVVDYLADVPALTFSTVPEDTTGTGLNDGGLSLLNLRGLGAARTLTLVDGRRHVGSLPNSLAVDIDTIPRLLIESVEIITGGAASVYGADAVSGVVNFILKDDFEGLEVDASYAQVNQDGQASQRLSVLWGGNFLDDTLNVYATGEYQRNDETLDRDLDWLREGWGLLAVDADPSTAPDDGVRDQVLVRDLRTFIRGTPFGGITILATGVQPSPASDPDIPFGTCSATTFAAGCFSIAPSNNPNNSFLYNAQGQTMPLVFGDIRQGTGFSRTQSNGGNGQEANTDQAGASRLPESEAYRFQTGFTWALSDRVELFGEAKYAEEETFDASQRTFFDFNIRALPAGQMGRVTASNAFEIGIDNAYLPANVRTAIQNNVRTIYNSAGQVTGTVADPRAQHKLYPTSRSQLNNRDLQRYVLGLRGEAGDVGFIRNLNWEVGYTYGEMNNTNRETGTDNIRVQAAADAVVDAAGIVNGRPGEIVCRVQLLAAQGTPAAPAAGVYSYGGATTTDCVPIRIFGEGGISEEALAYLNTSVTVSDQNRQQDFLAFASGELWDFWGAGPIGFAVGVESRKESTSGVGRDRDTAGRLLFLNGSPDFDPVSYETREAFIELRLPLFRDSWLGRSAEISGSYRTSDYSSIGLQDTYSIQASWRPIDDFLFRATQNTSIRVPDLGELFDPGGETFVNFTDPCAITVIQNTADATIRANRVANCTALANAAGLNFNFNPANATAPNSFTPVYGTGGISGNNGGNPFLAAETSESNSFSVVWTPSVFPNFSLVLDYFNIEIDDAISTVGAQQAVNQCVAGAVLNTNACATIFRDPNTFLINGFIQSSLNYAKLTAEGVDFAARYRHDLENVFGRDLGRLDWNLRGTWTIEQHDFVNIDDPSDFDANEGKYVLNGVLQNLSRVRYLSTLNWSPNPRLSVIWDWDWQSSQEILSARNFVVNADIYDPDFRETGAFSQHDFTVRYNLRDDIVLRAGVVNAFDEEPARHLGRTTADAFDLFGRRYFVGVNARF
ncbi:hypothetical protein IP78_00210 [Brevundimonas sp. AAP58]|uniref:TonB-dependent receptor domain-containing protein n=1 Tax=Brevundimonas sp. AAP58 TaxID=1523422 RepID=UPI0006CD516B|nr:TonB-dependent receptor [Brevundimonas sp. AAP58]KPF85058.1 hypothetical protein IP78_00210 [Brevundimonas sp. AAP58]